MEFCIIQKLFAVFSACHSLSDVKCKFKINIYILPGKYACKYILKRWELIGKEQEITFTGWGFLIFSLPVSVPRPLLSWDLVDFCMCPRNSHHGPMASQFMKICSTASEHQGLPGLGTTGYTGFCSRNQTMKCFTFTLRKQYWYEKQSKKVKRNQ